MEGDRDRFNVTPADFRERRQFSRHLSFKHVGVKDDPVLQNNACERRQLVKHSSFNNLDKKNYLDVQHKACNLRSDGFVHPMLRPESPWSCHGSPSKKVIPKMLVSHSDFDADRDTEDSDADSSDGAIVSCQSPLSPATLQLAESFKTTTTSSHEVDGLDQWYVTKLLLQLQTDPKRFSKKLSDLRASCHVHHETAADVAALATGGYIELLLENGVLQSLLVMLSSSKVCCRTVAIHTLRVLLHLSVSYATEVDCQPANPSKMRKLKGFLASRFSKNSLLAFLSQHDKAVKQLMVLMRQEDSDDTMKQDVVDVLRLFIEQTDCLSSFKKYNVAQTLLIIMAGARNNSLLNSMINLLSLLPQQMLLANVSELHDAVPVLTGLLSSSNPEVAVAALRTLQLALQHSRLFCLAFAEAQGLNALEPLLYFSRTARPALELMWLMASHSCTHQAFLNNRSLSGVVAVAESADQQSVLLALELLTTLSRCNRDCRLELLHHEAVPVLQSLVAGGDKLLARSAAVALHALSGVVRS